MRAQVAVVRTRPETVLEDYGRLMRLASPLLKLRQIFPEGIEIPRMYAGENICHLPTVMGDGAGPRTMVPREGNLILAAADQVAVDAVAAKIMGFGRLFDGY